MASNHKFTFYGDGDHEPGKEAGDIIIQLEEKKHHMFQRHGPDLSMRMDLSLAESLCGLSRTVKTLDNRTIVISTKPGEVIKHGDTKMILGEGFPRHRDPFNKGRLIIVFSVDFPDSLTEANAKKIASALPKVNRPTLSADVEQVALKEFDGQGSWKGGIEENGNEYEDEEAASHGGGAYRSQQSHFQGGPQAQCAQQ